MSNILLLYDAEKLDRVKITLQLWFESIFLVKTLRVKNSYVGKIDDYSVNNAATQKILRKWKSCEKSAMWMCHKIK